MILVVLQRKHWWGLLKINRGGNQYAKTLKKYLVCTIFLPLFSYKIKSNGGSFSKLCPAAKSQLSTMMCVWSCSLPLREQRAMGDGGSGVSMMGEVDEDDLHVKKETKNLSAWMIKAY